MCCSLNIYMKYIYAEYFMVYLLRVRLKRLESPHHFLQHGGGGARRKRPFFSPSPFMLTPYPPRHASTTIWRGVRGGGKRGGGLDLSQSAVCQAPVNICRSTLPPPFLDYSLASTLLLKPEKAKRQPPHVAAHL